MQNDEDLNTGGAAGILVDDRREEQDNSRPRPRRTASACLSSGTTWYRVRLMNSRVSAFGIMSVKR